MSFDQPYGLVGPVGKLSSTGTLAGSPYTVAEDEKTMSPHPASAMTSSNVRVPCTFTS